MYLLTANHMSLKEFMFDPTRSLRLPVPNSSAHSGAMDVLKYRPLDSAYGFERRQGKLNEVSQL